ncbi:MAG: 4-hydroxy-tetrahydrodipicolinate reductase [Bernardetiaceae bacterium]|nr:4-hydroxy-tetrahydrodipicolinate reductase [Bernardetiaceae bacterium]
MRIALIGYGKMGRAIEQIALAQKDEITIKVCPEGSPLDQLTAERADVAIEFTSPDAAAAHISYCLERGIPVVSGSTGWLSDFERIKNLCLEQEGAFFYASNFSIGVALFRKVNQYLAKLMQPYDTYNIGMQEIHHTEKRDAPSGTAVTLAEDILALRPEIKSWHLTSEQEKSTKAYNSLPIEALREPDVKGTHEICYQSDIDRIRIIHEAHSRVGFAQGAWQAAHWLKDKKGIFGMEDMLNMQIQS